MIRTVLIFLFLIAAVALFFLVTRPYLDDINNLKVDKQNYDEALAHSRELETLRDQLLSQYNAVPLESVERLNKMLPLNIDSGGLIGMAEGRALAHGLLLKKMELKEELTDSPTVLGTSRYPYKAVALTFSVSGPYASVVAFFADLEQSLRLIDVNAVGFSSGLTDNYEFSITAKTYYVAPSSSDAISAETAGGQEILAILAKLKNVRIDQEFFNSDIFKSLVDFVPVLEIPEDYGRTNPFAPIR